MVATHYQRLGVEPSASTDEIRAAYRLLARRLHPDRLGDTTGPERDHAERRMREINESWEVLRDAGRRRRYDEGRLEGPRRAAASATAASARTGRSVTPADDDDLVDVLPEMGRFGAGAMRHGPWLVLVLVLGLIFVATAYAGGGDDPPAPRRAGSDLVAGSCVDTGAGTEVEVVPCTGPHEYVVVGVAATADSCPTGSEARRFSNASLWDCLSPADGS